MQQWANEPSASCSTKDPISTPPWWSWTTFCDACRVINVRRRTYCNPCAVGPIRPFELKQVHRSASLRPDPNMPVPHCLDINLCLPSMSDRVASATLMWRGRSGEDHCRGCPSSSVANNKTWLDLADKLILDVKFRRHGG